MTDLIPEKLALLPDKPGCYLMKDAAGEVIYVGKAKSLRSRVRSYFQKGQEKSPKVQRMVDRVSDFDLLVTDSEVEALILENTLIKKHRPYFNVRLRDDKQYPYLMVTTGEEFPRVFVVRQPRQDGNRYYGPYTSSQAVYQTLQFLRQAFQLASCKLKFTSRDRLKPCLYHHINQCLAPCAGLIDPKEYGEVVREVCLFLEGKQDHLLKRLETEMLDAAERLDFERAARLRNQRDALMKMIERQKVVTNDDADRDVLALLQEGGKALGQVLFIRGGKLVGEEHFLLENGADEEAPHALSQMISQFYEEAAQIPPEILVPVEVENSELLEEWLRKKRSGRVELRAPLRGEKRRLIEMAESNARESLAQLTKKASDERAQALEGLEQLRDALDLPTLPGRIECYDISNFQGTEAVGSMVVFRDGKPDKASYRRFRIRGLPEEPNDFLMMEQVLRRRLQNALDGNAKFLPLPDLVVIDGGKGQLNAATGVMEETGVILPVIGLAKREEEVFVPGEKEPVPLSRHSPGSYLLQRIRDEAHRFAVTYHRQLRGKQATVSLLDQIPGVGKARRTALLKHFRSVAEMMEASPEELAKAPGMTKPVARAIHAALHETDNEGGGPSIGGDAADAGGMSPAGAGTKGGAGDGEPANGAARIGAASPIHLRDIPPEELLKTANVVSRGRRRKR